MNQYKNIQINQYNISLIHSNLLDLSQIHCGEK